MIDQATIEVSCGACGGNRPAPLRGWHVTVLLTAVPNRSARRQVRAAKYRLRNEGYQARTATAETPGNPKAPW